MGAFYDYLLLSTPEFMGVELPVGAIVFGLTVGLAIAAIAVCFYKRTIHLILKRLLRKGATDRVNAKNLSELHLEKNRPAMRMLQATGKLRALLETTEDGRYFIPEGALPRAKRIYEEGAPSVFGAVLCSLLILFFGTGLLLLLPNILALF